MLSAHAAISYRTGGGGDDYGNDNVCAWYRMLLYQATDFYFVSREEDLTMVEATGATFVSVPNVLLRIQRPLSAAFSELERAWTYSSPWAGARAERRPILQRMPIAISCPLLSEFSADAVFPATLECEHLWIDPAMRSFRALVAARDATSVMHGSVARRHWSWPTYVGRPCRHVSPGVLHDLLLFNLPRDLNLLTGERAFCVLPAPSSPWFSPPSFPPC